VWYGLKREYGQKEAWILRFAILLEESAHRNIIPPCCAVKPRMSPNAQFTHPSVQSAAIATAHTVHTSTDIGKLVPQISTRTDSSKPGLTVTIHWPQVFSTRKLNGKMQLHHTKALHYSWHTLPQDRTLIQFSAVNLEDDVTQAYGGGGDVAETCVLDRKQTQILCTKQTLLPKPN
jgi:hypothetical protein